MIKTTINPLTNNPCKVQLLETIKSSSNDCSLFALAIDAGLPYATAYRQLKKLANQGLVEIESQGPGSKLTIEIREGI